MTSVNATSGQPSPRLVSSDGPYRQDLPVIRRLPAARGGALPLRGIGRTLGALAVAVALLVPALPWAQSPPWDEPRFGINRVNMAWLSPEARRQVLADMAAHGVELVRLSLTSPFEASIDAVKVADAEGMAVLLEIPLTRGDFVRTGAEPRSGLGRAWDVYGLSDIDLTRFRAQFGAALRRIDAAGIALEAIEIGNEINWAPFNGDLHVYPQTGVHTARSVAELEKRRAFERGLNNYVMMTAIVRYQLEAARHNRDAKIISAGLSDISGRLADSRGIERLDAAEVVALLRERGIERFIDAYGMHLYPDVGASAEAREARIRSLLSFCAPPPSGRPCSVTEWGVPNPSRTCPPADAGRAEVVEEVRTLLAELMSSGHVTTAFYYDWDSESPYSVWRCNDLTAAGRAAVTASDPALPQPAPAP